MSLNSTLAHASQSGSPYWAEMDTIIFYLNQIWFKLDIAQVMVGWLLLVDTKHIYWFWKFVLGFFKIYKADKLICVSTIVFLPIYLI